AAWLRRFPARNPGYGFVAEDVPELSIAVAKPHRGRGIGSGLLRSLATKAREQGVDRISLSVEHGNPAKEFYTSLGFTTYSEQEGALTLVLDLRTSPLGQPAR